jgi:DNA-binding protein H-NS
MNTVQTATQAPAPKDKAAPPANANGHAASESDPPPIPNLKNLSDDELALLAVEAPRELERRHAKRETELLAFFREQAMVLGIPLARLRAALGGKTAAQARTTGGDGRSTVVAKYKNPATGETWTGRGKPPPWIEFGNETLPPNRPGGEPRRVPLAKFLIRKDQK